MDKERKKRFTSEDMHANYINTLLNQQDKNIKKSPKEEVLDRIKIIELDPENFKEDDGSISNKITERSQKRICIITEDRGNGFQFITSYILQNYSDMSGIIIGAAGKDNIRYILEEYIDYDTYIFVIDRGISESDYIALDTTIKEFRKNKKDIPMYIFQPQCMEEVWLSFYKIDEYIQPNNSLEALDLQKKLINVLNGKIMDVDYTQYKNLQTSTPEQICEKLVFELTDTTPFKCYHGQKKIKGVQPYIPAYLSPCWRCRCCTVNKYNNLGYVKISDCKQPNILTNKLDYIAQHSLLCGLTYIIDKIYGFAHRKNYWSNMNNSYLNELVKEL